MTSFADPTHPVPRSPDQASPVAGDPWPAGSSGSVVQIGRHLAGPLGRAVAGHVPPPLEPWLFAVEDTSVQITWQALGPGPLRFRAADTVVDVTATGGPGSVVLDGLPADHPLTITIDGDGLVFPTPRGSKPVPRRWRRLDARTLPSPPGVELFRFGTISDLHIGTATFGFRDTMIERPQPAEPHPVRATRHALDAMAAWGARRCVVKGDLTHEGGADDWATVGRLLDEAPIPVEIMPGNHDHYGGADDPDPYHVLADRGLLMTSAVATLDEPGVRIVMIDSTTPGHGGGHVRRHQRAVVDALRATDRPAFLSLHHYAQRLPIPTFWPPGIPSYEANRFLGAIAAVKPATFISSGHTHRHRRRHIGPLAWTEVGSPKDYPGTWAGYVVHEGGIRQVVRRVDTPDLLRWTDLSASAVFGAWGLWSPGVLSHRCFTHPWPSG